MDPKRFDRIARALGKARIDRRGVAGAVLGVGGLAAVYRLVFAQPACAGDGQSCTIMSGCCDGFVCHVSMMNPNFGACRAGEDIFGTGWTFAGMTALPAVATEIARERRRKKGRNKKRNSNKRARATATPAPTSTPIPQATVEPPTPTPDPGDGPTPAPTAGPDVTPPPTDQSVDMTVDVEWQFTPEVTRIKNKGVTNFKVTTMMSRKNPDRPCINPMVEVPVGETVEIKTGQQGSWYSGPFYYGIDDSVDIQVSYQTAPGVVHYAAFRGYCNGDRAARLQSPVLTCS